MRTRICLVALALLALVATAQADKWRFVVAGDSRSDPSAKPPRTMDHEGVNTVITKEIAAAVIRENAKFLMWTGDLVLGASSKERFERQLMTWRKILQPVYDKKIPVLACRGNHEVGGGIDIWNKVFSGRYAMPHNGPKAEENLSFFYKHEDVLVIGLDQFVEEGISVDQRWLDSVLRQQSKPFIFAMGHEPAFMDGAHKDNMDNSPAKRDAFVESLINAGGRSFFCGHDHLYDHMVCTKRGEQSGVAFHQFVAGTAGAPFYSIGDYSGNNTVWDLTRVKHIDKHFGYLLVEIDGDKATITFKGRAAPGKYVPMDSWSYTAVPIK